MSKKILKIFISTLCLLILFTTLIFAKEDNMNNFEKELRGVWIATTLNIDFPSKQGLSALELQKELDDIVCNARSAKLNAIFFQVRPSADALYPSEIFPYSNVISGVQGIAPENNFDPLGYMIQKCHENGIELHAWINPYRVTMNSVDINSLADTNPAKLYPEYVIPYVDNKLYFDPGLPEVRKLIIDGVIEILEKYKDIDGIHFDDYFYPYPKDNVAFDDSKSYNFFGNGMSLGDWRRDNINILIRDTYKAIKSINPNCSFGVSPFAIWANENSNTPIKGSATNGLESYISLYCDPVSWANEGTVDYIAPQIYWQFSSSASAFDTVSNWWNAALDGTNVDLYIAHAAYKAKDFARNEIPMQVNFARSLLKYKGSIFYGYASLCKNSANIKDGLEDLYSEEIFYTPPVSDNLLPKINYPVNNTNQGVAATYLLGSSDPSIPLYYNGEKISRTKDGYFALYSNLNYGKNYFILKQGSNSITHTLNCTVQKKDGAIYEEMNSFEIIDYSPTSEFNVNFGETIEFSCVAPSGSKVIAVIGGMTAELKPTIFPPQNAKYMKEVYIGSIKPSKFAKENKSAILGNLKFMATLGEESVSKSVGLVTQNALGQNPTVPADPATPAIFDGTYAEIINDYSHLKISSSSSFYNDYTPINKGMRDYIVGKEDGYYKLRFGGYVSQTNVKLVSGVQLLNNRILYGKMNVINSNPESIKNNSTDITLGIIENAPNNVNILENKIIWTIYNTDSAFIPSIEIVPNPLIENIEGVAAGENKIIYTLTLKNAENFYGFNVEYSGGAIVLRLTNPQTLNYNSLPLSGKIIVVDAGHGGSDSGAMGPTDVTTGLHENDLNLSIALELQKELLNLGANVIMTRIDDVTVSLDDRITFLNDKYPDMAISIHHNSLPQASNPAKIRGYLQLYSNNSGILLSKTISKTVCNDLARYERNPSFQLLAVARNHRFPSTLCEMSYLTSPEEFQWEISKGNYSKSAKALANGIIEYYKAQEKYLEY